MEDAVSAVLKMGRKYVKSCMQMWNWKVDIKGWQVRFEPDVESEKTLAEISQKENSLAWLDTKWCFVVFGRKLHSAAC